MAVKKPLVLGNNGHPQQLQPGDTIDAAIAGGSQIIATNGETGSITIGQPVFLSAADTVMLAQANGSATADPVGLVASTSIAAAANGAIQIDGILSISDWTSVIGSTNLTPGAEYFLDPANPGQMTTIVPSAAGELVTSLGKAINTTDFLVEIQQSILL